MTSKDLFDQIESQYNSKLPFVVYRKPNRVSVQAILQETSDLHFTEDFTEKGFVFSPFDDADKNVLIPIVNSKKIKCNITSSAVKRSHYINQTDIKNKEHHIALVKKGVDAIKENQFKKVVLSRSETIKHPELTPLSIFKNLLASYESAFVYCWYHPKVGLWLGATPETLIKIEGKHFSIMALAGTQDYKGSLDVVWQEKEKQEQQFVTDFIIDNLKSSVESFKVSDVETVKAGNLVHLKTMISAQLKSETLLKQVIESLHPTPAVCGLPKLSAKQFILKHEDYNREFYTGFLGELNLEITKAPRSGRRNIENRAYAVTKNSTQLYVNLRCMQLKDQHAIIYVGGGITKQSKPEIEWEETVSKSLVIKSVL